MKEYRIKIAGKYDVIVLSPKMIAVLIDKIRHSDTKELVIPAKEILPQGYAKYIARVLGANTKVTKTLVDESTFTLIAEQIRKMQFNEKDCFDSVDVAEFHKSPKFEMIASEDFQIVTKQENSQFYYMLQNENGEDEFQLILPSASCLKP